MPKTKKTRRTAVVIVPRRSQRVMKLSRDRQEKLTFQHFAAEHVKRDDDGWIEAKSLFALLEIETANSATPMKNNIESYCADPVFALPLLREQFGLNVYCERRHCAECFKKKPNESPLCLREVDGSVRNVFVFEGVTFKKKSKLSHDVFHYRDHIDAVIAAFTTNTLTTPAVV